MLSFNDVTTNIEQHPLDAQKRMATATLRLQTRVECCPSNPIAGQEDAGWLLRSCVYGYLRDMLASLARSGATQEGLQSGLEGLVSQLDGIIGPGPGSRQTASQEPQGASDTEVPAEPVECDGTRSSESAEPVPTEPTSVETSGGPSGPGSSPSEAADASAAPVP
jgi:hypothetical protein